MNKESVERRLTAVLAADVVSYSRLMEADEEGTHARLRSLREELIAPMVAAHRGRIVKLTGDGVLVEFPSVVQAVTCAVEIQRGMAARNADIPEDERIVFRTGVNLGDVIIEDEDIYGGGVNVAARLEGLADPGGILISGTAYDQVEGRVECGFEFAGEKEVKNIERPVRAYRVLLGSAGSGTAVARRPARTSQWRWASAGLATVILVAIAIVGWPRPWEHDDEVAPEVTVLDTHRIAVLPFANISSNGGDEYFAEGMTEELISQLSKIGELGIIARTSVLKYKDTNKGIVEIGRELNVGTILEGSVRKAGDQVRITTQLIDVASEAHLWAENYDRDLDSIFAVQGDIARQVAEALRITLLPETAVAVGTPGTENSEAYDAYLQGLYFWNQRTADASRKAKSYFEKAIALDPNFATAYAKLSDNYYRYASEAYDMPPDEVAALARQTAEKAIELSPNLAEGHSALAGVKLYFDWDWHGAEAELRKAIELNPSYSRAHKLLGHQLFSGALRRHEEGISEMQLAVKLDPWSPSNQSGLGWAYYHAERFDEALAQFRKTSEMFPEQIWTGVGVA